jgi:hypothetical protein
MTDPSGTVHDARRAYEGGDFPRAITLIQGVINSVGPIADSDDLLETAQYAEKVLKRELSEIARRAYSEDMHDLLIALKAYGQVMKRYPLHPDMSDVEARMDKLRRAIDYMNDRFPSPPSASNGEASRPKRRGSRSSLVLWILFFASLFSLAVVLGHRLLRHEGGKKSVNRGVDGSV